MKKLFTLAFSLILLSSAAFSQSIFAKVSFRNPNVNISVGHRYVENYSMPRYQRDAQIQNINAYYKEQVREVMNLRISASKKVDLIQQLQREKSIKIQNINDRFSDYRNKYNYNYYDDNYNYIR